MNQYVKLAKSVILGTITGIFATVALMVIFALVINSFFGDPDSVLNIFTGVAASLGASAGGFYASKTNGSKGFISGITTGFTISLVILAVMLFSGKSPADADSIVNNSDITFRLIIILCQVIFACIGGVFAVNSRKNKKTSKKIFRR